MSISRKLLYMMIFLLTSFQLKAEITFTPAKPVVETEEQIALSVSGTAGEIKWSAQSSGKLEGTATTVSYIAPSQPGWDVVTVMDAEANVATVKIQINGGKPNAFSSENANWKVFINRDDVQALALSKDKTTLWVGTTNGWT